MQIKHICVLIHIWTKGEIGAPLNRFKPSSKIFYWPFQCGTSFVDLLCFSVLYLLCLCTNLLHVPCGHLLGKGWPLGSRLWCLTVSCYFPIGILGQVWYLIVSIPDLCTLTYFYASANVISFCRMAPMKIITYLILQYRWKCNVPFPLTRSSLGSLYSLALLLDLYA